jgi:hypothetical protein
MLNAKRATLNAKYIFSEQYSASCVKRSALSVKAFFQFIHHAPAADE